MPKNVLIYGGYNWFGYEIINTLLRENSFTHFIIVDSFQNHFWKSHIKDKFDNYRHLYEEDIFLWSIDVKDRYKLEELYKAHNITHVINNIKYNTNDVYSKEKTDGYRHIAELNIKYNIQSYICLYRKITHDTFGLNHDKLDHVLICQIFNDCVKEINAPLRRHMELFEIELYDYVCGPTKDPYNDIVAMYKNIVNSQSPLHVQKCNFYMQYDDELVKCVEDMLTNRTPTQLTRRQYAYIDLYETVYFHITKNCRDKERQIKDDAKLLNHIQDGN